MIVIGLSDVHGDRAAINRMGNIIRCADVVLLVGDITTFGRETETAHVVTPVLEIAKKVLAVSGNCDYPENDAYLDRMGINLHGRCEMVDGIGFVGLGGSLTTPFHTPNEYSESEIELYLNRGTATLSEEGSPPLVLVSHQPPIRTRCDRLAAGSHVGSYAVRRFIETRQPMVCFTGHIHEARAVDTIGPTHIINPGMLTHGCYAYAEIGGQGAEVLEIRSI
jgi:Icc-related predicted phosphoesterase